MGEIGNNSRRDSRAVIFSITGAVSVGSNKCPSIIMPYGATVFEAVGYARTAPVGAALIFDINKDGVSLWTDQDNRLTIADGVNSGEEDTFDVVLLEEGDRLDLDVDQVGSGTAGSDVTVELMVGV